MREGRGKEDAENHDGNSTCWHTVSPMCELGILKGTATPG